MTIFEHLSSRNVIFVVEEFTTTTMEFSCWILWMKFFFCFVCRFEDGTLPYLSIVSLLAGYETIEQLIPGNSMQRISRHCFNLAKYLYESLKALKYSNGQNVIQFYHDTAFESMSNQGGTVNFNVLHEDGSFVGFSEVCQCSLSLDFDLLLTVFLHPWWLLITLNCMV